MGEKLVKINNEFYSLYDSDGDIVASNNPKTPTTKKLSIANCEAIANGYDLDELAGEYANKELNVELTSKAGNFYGFSSSFKEGFQKALEILGDKKFSEKDMSKAWSEGYHRKVDELNGNGLRYFDKFIQSLQQTEWDVEIEMEEVLNMDYKPSFGGGSDSHYNPMYVSQPKLDADGCLILKRK
jgi:hypothetical protein